MSSPWKQNSHIASYRNNQKNKIIYNDSLLSGQLCLLFGCKHHPVSLGKMSLFTAFVGKGSVTLEAAAALPLFLFFCLSLFVFFQLFHVQSKVQMSLIQSARKLAVVSYAREDNLALLSTAYVQTKIWSSCPPAYLSQMGVAYGAAGMSAAGSEIPGEGEMINLLVKFRVKPLFPLLTDYPVGAVTAAAARAWTGEDRSALSGLQGQGEIVYRTEYGTVYHTDADCAYLKPSVTVCDLNQVGRRRNADGEIYHSCELCGADAVTSGSVFITKEGNRYHTDLGCSALKRLIYAISLEDVECPSCSKCAGNQSGE